MAIGPTMGSPLESPDTDIRPGVARPSQLLGGDEGRSSPNGDSEPDRQMTQVVVQTKRIQDELDQLAASYPAAAPNLRKAAKALREAVGQIAATGSGSAQETPNPRMLG